nr:glycoside hydrolase family 25 protein [uncultured Flavobacterium sp.]
MKRVTAKKNIPPKRIKPKKTGQTPFGKLLLIALSIFFVLFIFGALYNYRTSLLCYLGFRSERDTELTEEEREIEDLRIFEVLSRHDTKLAGFDVSEYQGKIQWDKIDKIDEDFPLSFVFVRATAGCKRTDCRFDENWKAAKENFFIRGAYHYYRPNENSIAQADHFIKTVRLGKGDLPPVLDIEKLPREQSMDSLKVGLRRWLKRVENHYKVRPIIYSGESYYTDFLMEEFKEYPFWIANYNYSVGTIKDGWMFWQFTEKAQIKGIKGLVDVNVYNGNIENLKALTID